MCLCVAAGQMYRQGADANCVDHDQRSPLHVACAEGHVEIVQYLLEHGASVYSRDRFGRMPLRDAIWGRSVSGATPGFAMLQRLCTGSCRNVCALVHLFSTFKVCLQYFAI